MLHFHLLYFAFALILGVLGFCQNSLAKAVNASRIPTTGVVLVYGATPSLALSAKARQSIEVLRKKLVDIGIPEVHVLKYNNDLRIPRDQMIAQATASLLEIVSTSSADFDMIAHSMGHQIGLAAIIESRSSQRFKKLIGLAGAAYGGDQVPLGCGKVGTRQSPAKLCPGLQGTIQGQPDYVLRDYYLEHDLVLRTLDKCSLAVTDDHLLSPNTSGFFEDGRNYFINFAGHASLPQSPKLLEFIENHCDFYIP